MQEMMRSMQSNPGMMKAAMAQMNAMRPEDIQQASERMRNMTPEEISAQASQATSQMSSREKYLLDAAKKLKADGNNLHGSGSYSLAAEKYEKARDNIQDLLTPEAADLKRLCTLNLSSCYLNTQMWGKCVAECNLVLEEDRDNLKALYRRGQAYLGSQDWEKSAGDLERAARLSSSDIPQLKLIMEKLEEARAQVKAGKAKVGSGGNGLIIEDVTEQKESRFPTPLPRPTPSSSLAANSQVDDGMADAVKMMAQNPEMAKMAAEMFKSMPSDQIEAMTRSHQFPGGMKVTPEMAKMAAESMSSMSATEISKMAEMATSSSMNMGGGGKAGGMPKVTPEMAKMATEMMGKMKPEDIEQMQQMASSMNMGGGGGLPPSAAMDMMNDPKFMENAMEMMRSMDESSLASMMSAQGGMSRGQAEAAVKQIKGMSDTQMKMMVKAGTVLQTGARFASKAKGFILSKAMLVLAAAAIIIGLLLQRYYS